MVDIGISNVKDGVCSVYCFLTLFPTGIANAKDWLRTNHELSVAS